MFLVHFNLGIFVVILPVTLTYGSSSSVLKPNAGPNVGSNVTNVGPGLPPAQRRIMSEMSWPLRMQLLKDPKFDKKENTDNDNVRPVHMQALVLPSRRDEDNVAQEEDNTMKKKLFRLMYESVRDSDLKVKKAELIKKSYDNSSEFELGYLFGDIADKFSIMQDIGNTLKRLYSEWKPIEHINAYEQIANLGIEITHVVDMIKGVEKKLRGVEKKLRGTDARNDIE